MASLRNEVSTKIIGDWGENLALDYIREKGYQVKEMNFRTVFGEIDIIARDKDCLCFIEVKMRYSDNKGSPLEAISPWKIRHLSKAALCYLQKTGQEDELCRFDVLGIKADERGPTFDLLKDAFESLL
jgi:putative endonuclease